MTTFRLISFRAWHRDRGSDDDGPRWLYVLDRFLS